MSFAFCNGVVLQHVKLLGHDKTNEMAGPGNLVRVKHTVRLRGLYNPAMASYLFAAAGGSKTFGPVFRPGVNAPQTEQAVQWALQQPRKPFAFVAGGVMVVFGPKPITFVKPPPLPNKPGASPTPFLASSAPGASLSALLSLLGASHVATGVADASLKAAPDLQPVIKQKYGLTDCNNGPVSTARVVENIGDKTFMVEWEITTWINDAPAQTDAKGIGNFPTSPLLAQEYSMVHTIDQDFFTTRQVEGRAIFRSDVLQVLQLYPDQLRYWLGHPIPVNFSRSQIQVRAESDALTLAYRFIDQQRILNFDPNRFTRVEMTLSLEDEILGLESILRSGIHAGLHLVKPIHRIAAAVLGPIPWVGGMAAGAATAAGVASLAGMVGALAGVPVRHYHVAGRFWGHPARFRQNFETDALVTFMASIQDYINTAGLGGLGGLSPGGRPGTLGSDTAVPSAFAAIVGATAIPGSIRIESPFVGGDPFDIPIPFFGRTSIQLGDVRIRRRADLSGMFVEFDYSYMGSRLQTILPQIPTPPAAPRSAFGTAAEIARRLPTAPQPVVEPRPILPDPMQGTYLGICVANALRDSADLWVQVQDPPPVKNVPLKRRSAVDSVAGIVLP